jgi:hypothetical protein
MLLGKYYLIGEHDANKEIDGLCIHTNASF